MKKYRTISLILILASFLFTFSACKKDKDNNNETGTSSLDISLSAAYNLKSVAAAYVINIEILKISYHTSDDANATSGWIDVETVPGIYNLMDYVNDQVLIAFDPSVDPQTISQIRLLLGENNTVVENGETYDLETPSAQTSGLKVQVHLQMEPGIEYEIMLDFDPEESIKKTGNDQYKLQPVIRAVINP
jgi:hypothetical protein